jgi:hypothetical protein
MGMPLEKPEMPCLFTCVFEFIIRENEIIPGIFPVHELPGIFGNNCKYDLINCDVKKDVTWTFLCAEYPAALSLITIQAHKLWKS